MDVDGDVRVRQGPDRRPVPPGLIDAALVDDREVPRLEYELQARQRLDDRASGLVKGVSATIDDDGGALTGWG